MLRPLLKGTALVVVIAIAQVAYSQEAGSDQAYLQYEIQKVDPWGPFVLNLFLPFGIGSMIQGDTTGGLVVAAGHFFSAGLVLVGSSQPRPDENLILAGLGLATAASLIGLVFPHTYANAANEKLRRDLGIASIAVVLPEDGREGYGVQVTWSL